MAKKVKWIDRRRAYYASVERPQLIYDGSCGFCRKNVQRLKRMDLFRRLDYVDLHSVGSFEAVHPDLTKEKALKQICLVYSGRLIGGFDVLCQVSLWMPMLYFFIPVFYFPGMRFIGGSVYRFVARHRHCISVFSSKTCGVSSLPEDSSSS